MCALHAGQPRKLRNTAARAHQLLLEIGPLKLLACLTQGQIKRQRRRPILCRAALLTGCEGSLHFRDINIKAIAEYQQPLNQIAQLPDIAGPVMIAQPILRGDGKAPIRQRSDSTNRST